MVDNASESTSFIIALAAMGIALFFIILGWLPVWILFGVIVVSGLLYDSKFLATGAITGFSVGIFAFVNWFPLWVYFTGLIIAFVLLSTKIASKYVNIGEASK